MLRVTPDTASAEFPMGRFVPAVCEPGFASRAVFVPSLAAKTKKTPRGCLFVLAAELGFEPRHTESESAVLPLHNSARYFGRFDLALVYSSTII